MTANAKHRTLAIDDGKMPSSGGCPSLKCVISESTSTKRPHRFVDGAPTYLGEKHFRRAANRAKRCFGHATKRSRRLRARKKTGAREARGKGHHGRRLSEGASATEPECRLTKKHWALFFFSCFSLLPSESKLYGRAARKKLWAL